jgi:hypothetical protein
MNISYQLLENNISEFKIRNMISEITDIYSYFYSLPPRYEKVNKEEIFNYFFSTLKNSILIVAKNTEDKIIGYCHGLHIKDFSDFNKINFEENSIYISDYVILPEYRGEETMKSLYKIFIDNVQNLKYEYIYTRSRKDVTDEIALLINEDFKIFHKYFATTNEVTSERFIYEKKL